MASTKTAHGEKYLQNRSNFTIKSVVLRINRTFMVYTKEAHPEVVAAFSLDAQRAAAAAAAAAVQ
jgi:hypothetical protein